MQVYYTIVQPQVLWPVVLGRFAGLSHTAPASILRSLHDSWTLTIVRLSDQENRHAGRMHTWSSPANEATTVKKLKTVDKNTHQQQPRLAK
jgi:hypothetical protein